MNRHSSMLWAGAALACFGLACGDTGTGSDAGVDAGTGAGADAGIACTFGTCGPDGTCNPTTLTCELKGCTEGTAQPDVCSYGQYCGGAGAAAACYDALAPSCTNFGASGHALSWNQATSTGPIIYYVDKTTADTTWCTGDTPAEISVIVSLYNKNSTFATSGAAFPSGALYYVRPDGTQCDVTNCGGSAMFRPTSGYTVSADRKELAIKMNFCGVSGSSLSVGFYYTGGNEYCVAIPK